VTARAAPVADPIDAALDALRAALRAVHTAGVPCMGAIAANDPLALMRGGAEALIAAEAAAERLARAGRDLRDALAAAMFEAGATPLRLDHHTVSWAQKADGAVVTDPEALRAARPDLFRQPPPSPDLHAINKLLRAGHALPGVERRQGIGATLTVRSHAATR